jgi:hypothetical protein
MEDAPEPRRFTGRRKEAGTTSSDDASPSALVPGAEGSGGRGGGGVKRHVVVRQQVPDDILHDEDLNAALEVLPANYNFEVGRPVAFTARRTQNPLRTHGAETPAGWATTASYGESAQPRCLRPRCGESSFHPLSSRRHWGLQVHKTVWRIKQAGAKRVGLQFPEGLLMFACTLSDVFET